MQVELQAATLAMKEYFFIFLTNKINFFVRSLILEVVEAKLHSFGNFSDSP